MLLTGSYSLAVMNVVNAVLGSVVAALAAWFGNALFDKKTAILIGLGVAIMPYLIVFSATSMAEMLGGLLLLAWLIALYREKYFLVFLFGCLAALTREELTFLIGVTSIPLLYFRNYKGVLYSIIGLIFGLGIWSWIAYYHSGDPLNWLFERLQSTSRSTDFYAEEVSVWRKNVFIPITTLLQAFPLVVFFIWLKISPEKQSIQERKWFFLMGFLTLSNWIFFFLAQFKVIANSDPRFFILTLPITIVWFFSLWKRGYFKAFVTRNMVFGFLALTMLQLIVPYYRQYNLEPRRAAGDWIEEHTSDEMIWSDMAVSIVESGRYPGDFFSTEKLLPDDYMSKEVEAAQIRSIIVGKNIEYLTSYNAPFDYTQTLWPQIRAIQPFEWEGLTFVPVFEYKPYRMETFSIHGYLRQQFEAPLYPATVWKIYTN